MDVVPGGTPELERNLARTAEKYDALPYESAPVQRSHPARLAAIARLFGLDAPALATARVLELGSAGGGNIIPVAQAYPDARFVGIDLGKRQIDEGRTRVRELGLANVDLIHGSITEIGRDLGTFDYIICHGVYSWVPAAVQDKILEICGTMLSPDGIAYISYNVLPGWRMNQPLRDAFRVLIPEELGEAGRARKSRELVRMLAELTPDPGAYGASLRSGHKRISPHGDHYLYHEYLEDVNEPSTFTDFMKAANAHGLGYLGESEFFSMFPVSFGADFAERMRTIRFKDIVTYEQMLDVLTGISFRTTLLVAADRAAAIDRNLREERLDGLHLAAAAGMTLDREGDVLKLSAPNRNSNTYDDPVVMTVLERLFVGRPTTVPFADCVAGMSPQELETAREAILTFLMTGLIAASSEPMTSVLAGERPRVNRVARIDSANGRASTVNCMHMPVGMDELAMILVPRLDGTTDLAMLEDALVAAVNAGTMSFTAQDGSAPPPGRLRDVVHEAVARALDEIAALGMLEA